MTNHSNTPSTTLNLTADEWDVVTISNTDLHTALDGLCITDIEFRILVPETRTGTTPDPTGTTPFTYDPGVLWMICGDDTAVPIISTPGIKQPFVVETGVSPDEKGELVSDAFYEYLHSVHSGFIEADPPYNPVQIEDEDAPVTEQFHLQEILNHYYFNGERPSLFAEIAVQKAEQHADAGEPVVTPVLLTSQLARLLPGFPVQTMPDRAITTPKSHDAGIVHDILGAVEDSSKTNICITTPELLPSVFRDVLSTVPHISELDIVITADVFDDQYSDLQEEFEYLANQTIISLEITNQDIPVDIITTGETTSLLIDRDAHQSLVEFSDVNTAAWVSEYITHLKTQTIPVDAYLPMVESLKGTLPETAYQTASVIKPTRASPSKPMMVLTEALSVIEDGHVYCSSPVIFPPGIKALVDASLRGVKFTVVIDKPAYMTVNNERIGDIQTTLDSDTIEMFIYDGTLPLTLFAIGDQAFIAVQNRQNVVTTLLMWESAEMVEWVTNIVTDLAADSIEYDNSA